MKEIKPLVKSWEEDHPYTPYKPLGSTGFKDEPINGESEKAKDIYTNVFNVINDGHSNNGEEEPFVRPPKPDFPIRKPEKRLSFTSITDYRKEKDKRNNRSYPCSPKTEKNKKEESKKFFNEYDSIVLNREEAYKNIDHVAAPEKDPSIINIKPPSSMIECGAQTLPMAGIMKLKNKMKKDVMKKKRKGQLFSDSELLPVQENPDEEVGDEKLKKPPDQAEKPVLSE